MRRARYKFDPSRRYFSWAVAADVLDLPSLGEVVRAVKLTLATPYHFSTLRHVKGEQPAASSHGEAALWVFPGDVDDDKFLADAGVSVTAPGECIFDRREPVCLWCRFGEPEGRSHFQSLEWWEVAAPTDYPMDPVVNAPASGTGLEFIEGERVRHNGVELHLKPPKVQLLRVLDAHSPRYVTVEQIRAAVTKWKDAPRPVGEGDIQRAERAVATAISVVRGKLPAGLKITERDKSNGWALLADKS